MAKKFMKKNRPAPQARTRSAHRKWEVKPLDAVRVDGGTQSRVKLDEELAAEYAERMKLDPRSGLVLDTEDEPWPPLVAFFDGENHWLVDGFHRLRAAKLADLSSFQIDVKAGEVRDAVRLSLSVNAKHGLRRTRSDKRRSIERALADDEWVSFSDRKLGQLCAVSPRTVARVRKELEGEGEIEEQTERIGRDGSIQDVSTAVVSPEASRRSRTTSRERKKLDRAGLESQALEASLEQPVLEASRLDSLAPELERREALILLDGEGKASVSAVLDHLPALLASDGVLIAPMPLLISLPSTLSRLHESLGAPSSTVLEGSREVVLIYSRQTDLNTPGWTRGLGALVHALSIETPHLIAL